MFPVDQNRDLEAFLNIQESIMKGRPVSDEDELAWLGNGINSSAMLDHLTSRGTDYDLIIAGPYLFGITVSALKALPGKGVLIPCLHDEPFAKLNVFKNLFKCVKGVIFNTDPERKFAESIVDGALPANEVVGFSVPTMNADIERFRSSHPVKTPYVVYCGRREPMKGTPLLLDYMRTFRQRTRTDISLVLTGKGEVEMEEGDKDWIYDAGFLSEEDKMSAMAGAIAFCHPSTFESLGIVLLESWMAGTPCLVHAGSEVLADQCRKSNGGLWFRCYPDFEEELTALLESTKLQAVLAANGRKFVEKEYSRKATQKRLGDILSRLALS
jgi:glycosyltransferase involved in cell wall biosynthesis